MVQKNILRKLVLCALSFTNLIYCFDIIHFGKMCAAAGGVLLAAGAAAIGGHWSTDDMELIEQAKSDYRKIITRNEHYISLFKREFNWNIYSETIRQNVMKSVLEGFLYEIANQNYNKNSKALPTTIFHDCETLEYHTKVLLKRADKMEWQHFLTDKEKYNLAAMREWIEQIRGLQKELDLLKDYLVKHNSYFNLAECGWTINKKYCEEFDLYKAYKYDKYKLLQKLDKVVHAKHRHSTLAYINYIGDIDNALEKLKYARKKAMFDYTGMITWVDQCIEQLEFLRSLVEDRHDV